MKKLQPMKVMGHALQSTFSNLGFAFHISWPWMLLIFPLNAAFSLYVLWSGIIEGQQLHVGLFALQSLVVLASTVAFASIAVSWHRYILKDEMPQGLARLRLDSIVWRYIGNTILMALIFVVCAIPLVIVASLVIWLSNTAAIVLLPMVLFVVFSIVVASSYRLSIKLPAVAMERTDIRFEDAWRYTKGNFWAFVGIGLLFFLILTGVGLVVFALTYAINLTGNAFLEVFAIVAQLAINWVATILGVTLLTSLYGFFVEGREF